MLSGLAACYFEETNLALVLIWDLLVVELHGEMNHEDNVNDNGCCGNARSHNCENGRAVDPGANELADRGKELQKRNCDKDASKGVLGTSFCILTLGEESSSLQEAE